MPLLSYPVRQPWKVHLNLGNTDVNVIIDLRSRALDKVNTTGWVQGLGP